MVMDIGRRTDLKIQNSASTHRKELTARISNSFIHNLYIFLIYFIPTLSCGSKWFGVPSSAPQDSVVRSRPAWQAGAYEAENRNKESDADKRDSNHVYPLFIQV
jgi:hypothetical protein